MVGAQTKRRLAALRGEDLNMAYRRFYIEKENLNGGQVNLRGDLVHHIRDVCRFKTGDKFEVLAGDGQARLVEIVHESKSEMQAREISVRALPPLAKPYVTLCVSVPKLPKVDWIVEKCVELGAYEVRPFVSDFSFLRKTSELSENRLARWRKLVQGATQQSGRGDLMRIGEPLTLEKLLGEFSRNPSTMGLFPYEGESPQGLPEALEDLKSRGLDHLWVFVGSEGGFSPREVELFAKHGLNPTSLGDQILRVETACLALMSVIKYVFGTLR
jgi:16S rRNA (uracil1498-N3)-methyltransferase